ncbi:DinB family protein [Sanguibacter suaedae]|uniref:DinB family protein n=1 Tax=Sanguibacter suaedae TaxID=2795737 RepID=A0A934I5X5_9MICO|nr:DinB family protein [Sanguibacter suaedae]MBI9115833.1 DinB family protein [Sanguibacter suaedae]
MDTTGIPADTKDWTWVLDRPCPECGLDAGGVAPEQVGALVASTLPRWAAVLARPDARDRPDPHTWSPVEYAAHVRDVFDVMTGRLTLMLTEDDPPFADWDQDAAALAAGYESSDPVLVGQELEAAGRRAADAFGAVREGDVERPGRRSNGSVFTVATLGQYFVHDVIHHLHDVNA